LFVHSPYTIVHGLTVENIDLGKGFWNGRAYVTVHDEDHGSVPGVAVTGDWSGAINQTGDTGTSDGSGPSGFRPGETIE
jgi:hypothetical protein